MNVGRAGGHSRVRVQDEILGRGKSKEKEASTEKVAKQNSSDKSEKSNGTENARGQVRKRARIQEELAQNYKKDATTSDPVNDNASTAPQTTETQEAVPVTNEETNSLMSLAEKYVSQYEQKSGNSISSDQRKELVSSVYSFYSDPSRSGRLESIVFEATA